MAGCHFYAMLNYGDSSDKRSIRVRNSVAQAVIRLLQLDVSCILIPNAACPASRRYILKHLQRLFENAHAGLYRHDGLPW